MIFLPDPLTPVLKSLADAHIHPIIVGGFVRDALLNIQTNDIDIELYHLPSLEELQTLLEKFGKLNLVGKSFGVLKLKLGEYSLDFAPPRTESKRGFGHKGFEIITHQTLDFKSASIRRDFTINAIGYDPLSHTLLDPYGGIEDLKTKRLRYVDPDTFGEDPLRILRAIQFAARYELTCDDALLRLCRSMIERGALDELPKERIFEEIKKLLLLSSKPSIGLKLLDEMGGRFLLYPAKEKWEEAMERCDQYALRRTGDTAHDLPLLFASLLRDLDDPKTLLESFITQHSHITSALSIIHHYRRFGVLDFPPPPIMMGRDLILLGWSPSTSFSTLLDHAYEAQMRGDFHTHDEALEWCKHHLVTVS